MVEPERLLGLYVHIPFCEAKCTYCHFAIDPGAPGDDRQERYLHALLVEMEGADPGPADTLYFGGGTPSLLAPERLARIVEAARSRHRLPDAAEITLEANPRDLAREGYGAVRRLGVSRLSLGVQSFDDGVLREMGRLHSAADSRLALEQARAAGFENVSLDLILGWPGETRERWERQLEAAVGLEPEHLSLYVLEVEGKTLLSHRQRQGRLGLPDDDLVADLYARAVEALAGAGLERYEISNFARPGRESRHNAKYWDDAPFLGFGLSAHSYGEGRRWWNHDTFGAYCRSVEQGGAADARAGERALTVEEHRGEALFTGLRRKGGVDLPRFRARYGVDPLVAYEHALADSFAARLLEVTAGRLRLTEKGVLLSNEVFQALV